jgi:hypothetical protein
MPVAGKQSKCEVTEDEDSVVVAARQGAVSVADGQQTATVPEGQESTHKKKKKNEGAAPAAGARIRFPGKRWQSLAGHRELR